MNEPYRIEPEDRTMVIINHLSPLLVWIFPAIPVGNVIGALGAWLLTRDRSPVVDLQGKQVVNFQLSLTLYFFLFGLVFWTIGILTLGLGLLLLWPVWILWYLLQLIPMVLAVKATLEGYTYTYPLTIAFLK
ncbi:hypothetical protein HNR42_000538 [Deinobacterium chartae]|uniref:Tic20 family protein n=1 Tax=Deinobacterium chartae TaxID=521158 RepID=A0A841HWV5_9DEIO|nr:DUF4870 domain-containing protein [Deinobacterium chartae]MBB6097124.1 hypothetical protein [Deinobacterium chartae]